MPWWGWLLVSLSTLIVSLIWAIRCLFKEFINVLFNVMDISNVDWDVLGEEQALKTKST